MKQVWNVSPHPRVLDWSRLAVQPGASLRVDDDTAEQLCAGPDWSFTDPRKPPKGLRADVR